MYGCESWTIKKVEHQLMLLNCGAGEDSWESLGLQGDKTQSILKEISPEYSLERLMLKLKLQNFGHLMWRTDPLEKTLMLGKIEGRRRRGWQRMRWLDGITNWTWVWASSGSWWWTGKPDMLQSIVLQRVEHEWGTELNWTKESEATPEKSSNSSSTVEGHSGKDNSILSSHFQTEQSLSSRPNSHPVLYGHMWNHLLNLFACFFVLLDTKALGQTEYYPSLNTLAHIRYLLIIGWLTEQMNDHLFLLYLIHNTFCYWKQLTSSGYHEYLEKNIV